MCVEISVPGGHQNCAIKIEQHFSSNKTICNYQRVMFSVFNPPRLQLYVLLSILFATTFILSQIRTTSSIWMLSTVDRLLVETTVVCRMANQILYLKDTAGKHHSPHELLSTFNTPIESVHAILGAVAELCACMVTTTPLYVLELKQNYNA